MFNFSIYSSITTVHGSFGVWMSEMYIQCTLLTWNWREWRERLFFPLFKFSLYLFGIKDGSAVFWQDRKTGSPRKLGPYTDRWTYKICINLLKYTSKKSIIFSRTWFQTWPSNSEYFLPSNVLLVYFPIQNQVSPSSSIEKKGQISVFQVKLHNWVLECVGKCVEKWWRKRKGEYFSLSSHLFLW